MQIVISVGPLLDAIAKGNSLDAKKRHAASKNIGDQEAPGGAVFIVLAFISAFVLRVCCACFLWRLTGNKLPPRGGFGPSRRLHPGTTHCDL